MKIALVDDEIECLKTMEQFCLAFGTENCILVETLLFSQGENFLNSFYGDSDSFSIVFMDIFMEGMSGVEVAKKMRAVNKNCLLIFLTSSSDYMPEAFSCHAFEYVTKPVSKERIYGVLQEALYVLPPLLKYAEFLIDRKKYKIFFHDISSVTTDAHYLEICLTNGSILRIRMTMPEFLELTRKDPRFILVNKGVLLNADHISGLRDQCCVMNNGRQFPIRVRDRLAVEQTIRDYNFEAIRKRQISSKET